jgi:hypothetical protein
MHGGESILRGRGYMVRAVGRLWGVGWNTLEGKFYLTKI